MSDIAQVTFWGSRGSIATPGRSTEKYGGNTSCVSFFYNNAYYIFDAGTGIRGLGLELMDHLDRNPDQEKIELNLFLSHTHWDHIQGLPFFQPAYHPRFKLNIYGSEKKDIMLEKVLSGQMNSEYFPVPMSAFGSELNVHTDIENGKKIHDIDISFQMLDHPGGSCAFKFAVQGKSFVYATDNELNNQFNDNAEATDKLGSEYLEFIKDADMLIADGQYTDDEYPSKKGWGHTSLTLLHKISYAAGVKQLIVYHHDPMHTDSFLEDLVHQYAHSYDTFDPPMQVIWAREGLTISF